MVAHAPFGSPSFRLVAEGLIALHQQIKDGKDDSPEAESIRDDLDAPLKALNPIEKERAQWLSEDLYSISEPSTGVSQPVMNAHAQQQFNEVFEARRNQEWDRALEVLRQLRDYIAPDLLSYLRGSIWVEAGNPQIAAVFFQHAANSDPTNAKYMQAAAASFNLSTIEESLQ